MMIKLNRKAYAKKTGFRKSLFTIILGRVSRYSHKCHTNLTSGEKLNQ